MAAVAEQLGPARLGGPCRRGRGRPARAVGAAAEAARAAEPGRWPSWPQRLTAAQRSPRTDRALDATSASALAEAATAARQAEVEARLAVRTGEERVRALTGRAEQLERAAASERVARRAGRRAA